jgi:TRAP-type C4-dicarboxylate transport system permease small subunit
VSPEETSHLAASMTDDDLNAMLRRALRTVAILGVLLFLILTFTSGWQTGLLELAGAVISWTGIREWRNLALVIFARLDSQQNPKPMGRTLVMFFLRLGMAVAILYVSLKCLHGSVYALVAGLGLAVFALSIEAVRLLRR